RHREDEEHDHLAADVVQRVGERHEREVHRVEHELDAHEHHEDVAAGGEADGGEAGGGRGGDEGRSCGELRRGAGGQPAVRSRGAWVPRLRRGRTTARITASTSSAAVISNGQRKSVKSDRATRSTLLPNPGSPPWIDCVAGAFAPVAQW